MYNGVEPDKNKKKKKKFFISTWALGLIGIICATAGTISVAVVQNRYMDLSTYDSSSLMSALGEQSGLMGTATLAVALICFYYLAMPIAVYLTVEAYKYRSGMGRRKLAAGLLVCAIISEPFYDLVTTGTWWDYSSQNPCISLCICFIVLYFMDMFKGKTAGAIAKKIVVILAAILWLMALQPEMGIYMVALTLVFWFLSHNEMYTILAGIVATAMCIPAPLSFILIHFHDGDREPISRTKQMILLAAYPLQLAVIGVLATYI